MQFCLPRHVRFVSLATVVLAMGITGCGETKQIPVTGKIILDGKQLKVEKGETAAVNFYGTGDAKSFGVGVVSEDGTYTVSSNNKPGLPAGSYKVTVNYSKPKDAKDQYSIPVRMVNEKYTVIDFTDLKVEVKDNAPPGSYDLKVTK